jgi:Protein of unknown function (DUF3040)
VALPMDEQRILEEMERMLAAEDPRLAAKLSAFGQPGVVQVLRTRRARAALSLLMLAVIAAAAAVIYLVSAFRIGSGGPSVPHEQQTSQRASTRPEHRTVPLPLPVHCYAQVAPHTCTAWTTGAASGAQSAGGATGVSGAGRAGGGPGAGASHGPNSGHASRPG